jgi:putative spermidine/putrescine transport system permease protein
MIFLGLYGFMLVGVLLLPAAVLIVASFTAGERIVFPPEGLSVRWYSALFHNSDFAHSALTSFEVAIMTSLLSGVIGGLAAIQFARQRGVGHSFVDAMLMAPLAIPPVALGLAFLILYTMAGIAGTTLSLVAGHTILAIPFVIRLVRSNFVGYNWNIERAAANLGASPLSVFRHVTFPLILPGILGGMIFAFIVSFDEVVIAIFLSGPATVTLPVRIYNYIEQSPGPILLAASSILVLFAVAFMVLLESTVRIGRAFGVPE